MADRLLKRVESLRKSLFLGRADEFAALDAIFEHQTQTKLKVAVVQGLPGAGKTQLAVNYGLQYLKKHKECKLILFEAHTPEDYEASLRRFVRCCRKGVKPTMQKIHTWEQEDYNIPRTVKKKLENAVAEYLLIVDGVNEENFDLVHSSLPRAVLKSANANMLITTRLEGIQRLLVRGNDVYAPVPLRLGGLKLADGIKLLDQLVGPTQSGIIHEESSKSEQRVVLERLTSIPLLIECYATRLKTSDRAIETEAATAHVIEQVCGHPGTHTSSQLAAGSYYSVWARRIQHLQRTRPVAADFLCMLCVLHHHQVDSEMLIRGFTGNHRIKELRETDEARFICERERFDHLHALLSSREELKVVLQTFAGLGILRYTDDNAPRFLSFTNPTVQVSARMALMPCKRDRLRWLRLTLRAVEGGTSVCSPPQSLSRFIKGVIPHLIALYRHCTELGGFTPFLCVGLSLWADVLEEEGKYASAIEWKERAVNAIRSSETIGQDEASLVYGHMLQLGSLYLKACMWLPQTERLLAGAEQLVSQTHCWRTANASGADTRESLGALVCVLIARKNVQQLEAVLPELLRTIQSLEKDQRKDTVSTSAELLRLKDHYASALICIATCDQQWRLLEKAHHISMVTLRLKQQLFGPGSPEVIRSTQVLAEALWACFLSPKQHVNQADDLVLASEAVALMIKVHKWSEANEGARHPETMKALMLMTEWEARIEIFEAGMTDNMEGVVCDQ